MAWTRNENVVREKEGWKRCQEVSETSLKYSLPSRVPAARHQCFVPLTITSFWPAHSSQNTGFYCRKNAMNRPKKTPRSGKKKRWEKNVYREKAVDSLSLPSLSFERFASRSNRKIETKRENSWRLLCTRAGERCVYHFPNLYRAIWWAFITNPDSLLHRFSLSGKKEKSKMWNFFSENRFELPIAGFIPLPSSHQLEISKEKYEMLPRVLCIQGDVMRIYLCSFRTPCNGASVKHFFLRNWGMVFSYLSSDGQKSLSEIPATE